MRWFAAGALQGSREVVPVLPVVYVPLTSAGTQAARAGTWDDVVARCEALQPECSPADRIHEVAS